MGFHGSTSNCYLIARSFADTAVIQPVHKQRPMDAFTKCLKSPKGPSAIDNVTTIAQAQPWNPATEKLLTTWSGEAKERNATHEKTALSFKMLHLWTSAPLLLMCIAMAVWCSMYASTEKVSADPNCIEGPPATMPHSLGICCVRADEVIAGVGFHRNWHWAGKL